MIELKPTNDTKNVYDIYDGKRYIGSLARSDDGLYYLHQDCGGVLSEDTIGAIHVRMVALNYHTRKALEKALEELGNIREEDCIDGHIYRVDGRNISFGVYRKANKCFYGIRCKFADRFIDNEQHWDCGAPHGTCKALEDLGPYGESVEDLVNADNRISIPANAKLFAFLMKLQSADSGKTV